MPQVVSVNGTHMKAIGYVLDHHERLLEVWQSQDGKTVFRDTGKRLSDCPVLPSDADDFDIPDALAAND